MSTKKYSINWEDDEPVSFEVDGVRYESLDDIPNEADRSKIESMMDASFDQEFEKEFKKEFEAAGKSSFDPEKLILGIFSGVAALMLLVTAISSWNNIRKIDQEESASGRVVDMVVRREYVNEQDRIVRDYYFPVVEFVSGDGRQHSVQMTEGSSTPSYETGDEVTVLYDPAHPLDARIKSLGSSALMWVLPAITGVIGVGFLGAVLAVRKFMSPEQDE